MTDRIDTNAAHFHKRFEAANGRPLDGSIELVAGYGSLRNIPEPGLTYLGRGILSGFTKQFNVVERKVRGTPTYPGRVLGLAADPFGAASTALFRIRPTTRQSALAGLWVRELSGLPYAPRVLNVQDENGAWCQAIVFVPDGGTDVVAESAEQVARIILRAHGINGSNLAYFKAVDSFDREVPALRSPALSEISHHLDRLAQSALSYGSLAA